MTNNEKKVRLDLMILEFIKETNINMNRFRGEVHKLLNQDDLGESENS